MLLNIDAETYPWWPAVVYEYDDPRIPLVVKMEGEGHMKRGSAIYMVQFFDRTRSWWVDFVKNASRGKLRSGPFSRTTSSGCLGNTKVCRHSVEFSHLDIIQDSMTICSRSKGGEALLTKQNVNQLMSGCFSSYFSVTLTKIFF